MGKNKNKSNVISINNKQVKEEWHKVTDNLLESFIEKKHIFVPLTNLRKDVLDRFSLVIPDPSSFDDEYIKYRKYLMRGDTTAIIDVLGHPVSIATESNVCDLSAFPIKQIMSDTDIYGNIDTIILPAVCSYVPKYLLESKNIKFKFAGYNLPKDLQDYKDRIEMVDNPFVRIGTKLDAETAKVDITLIGQQGVYSPETVDYWIAEAKERNINEEVYIASNMSILEGYFGYGNLYKHLEYEMTQENIDSFIARSLAFADFSTKDFLREDITYSELKKNFK